MSKSSSNVSCPDFFTAHAAYNGSASVENVSSLWNTGSLYDFPSVKPNPDVSGSGVTLPFPFLPWSEFVPWMEAKLE